jgi:hypothetical protein
MHGDSMRSRSMSCILVRMRSWLKGWQHDSDMLQSRFFSFLLGDLGSMKPDVSHDRAARSLPGPTGIVMIRNDLPDLIDEPYPTVRPQVWLAFHVYGLYNADMEYAGYIFFAFIFLVCCLWLIASVCRRASSFRSECAYCISKDHLERTAVVRDPYARRCGRGEPGGFALSPFRGNAYSA